MRMRKLDSQGKDPPCTFHIYLSLKFLVIGISNGKFHLSFIVIKRSYREQFNLNRMNLVQKGTSGNSAHQKLKDLIEN